MVATRRDRATSSTRRRQRRRRTVRRHRGLRDDEGGRRHDHRVVVRAPAARRVLRAHVGAVPRPELVAHEPVGGVALATGRYAKTVPRADAVPVARPARADHGGTGRRARVDTARRSGRHRGARHPGRAVLDAATERDDRRIDPHARRVHARAREPRPTSASGRTPRSEHRSLHGHLGRRPRGRGAAGVPPVPRVALARRVRRVGATLREPVRRPRRLQRVPQLGQRRARSRRLESRRRRRRGAVPEHGPAVLPVRATSPRRQPTGADYEHRWAGLQAHNRWLADFCAAAPGRRAGIAQIFLERPRRRARRGPIGRRKPASLGGMLLPNVPPELRAPAAVGSASTSRCGTLCEELDVVVNIHSGERPARLRRRRPGRAGDHAHRDPVVRAPRASGT